MIAADLVPLAFAVDKLRLLPGNPRRGNVEAVKRSLDAFGQRKPIVARRSDRVVIAGNHTLQAAQALGWAEVAVVWVDDDDTTSKAFALADNRTAELGDYDEAALADLIGQVGSVDPELLKASGWDEASVAELVASLEPDVLPLDGDPDDVPEKVLAKSVPGDVWLLGSHRVMCGDSMSPTDVEKLMAGAKADMVFTDPPYGVSYQSNMRIKSEKFEVLKNDDAFLDIAPVVMDVCNGWVFIWTSWKVMTEWIEKLSALGYPTNVVIWDKGGGGIGDLEKTFSTDFELALVWNQGMSLYGKRIGSVWSIGKDSASSYVHPTQKPVALAAQAITSTTSVKGKILDLFGGSGSTLIAAYQTNRVAYLMELDPKYVDVICARFQKLTRIKPVNEATGREHDFLDG